MPEPRIPLKSLRGSVSQGQGQQEAVLPSCSSAWSSSSRNQDGARAWDLYPPLELGASKISAGDRGDTMDEQRGAEVMAQSLQQRQVVGVAGGIRRRPRQV